MAGDWLRTGDVGYRDGDGNYYVVDRKKRLIISGGENIYPSEVERVLLEHPAIAEAVVVGVPHDKWGEVPAVAVVNASGKSVDLDMLSAHLAGRLAEMKHPRHVVAFDALPKNAMGKVVIADVESEVASRLAGD